MRFDVLTIFPEFFEAPLRTSIIGRAMQAGKVECRTHNIRDWTAGDKHHCTDDAPYGGGGGMVMLAEPLLRAIRAVRGEAAEASGAPRPPVIYLSPQGEILSQRIVCELAELPAVILLCGTYEGIDERVVDLEVDREISIGDYVLTSGEPAALVLINAVARRIEGVLGNPASAPNDSFEEGLLDFPHYTRPETVEGMAVPPVLLSGHHANIVRWRREQALERTARRRPDLLARVTLTRADRRFLAERGFPAPGPGPAPSPGEPPC
ncbi:MAG: tRNA (guanosine(37)-N1)-methyltransferase TrmD [bacterium]|nr:tRNA (guanosine(37)-N1)-methyltransferase TrmD [bacterium]